MGATGAPTPQLPIFLLGGHMQQDYFFLQKEIQIQSIQNSKRLSVLQYLSFLRSSAYSNIPPTLKINQDKKTEQPGSKRPSRPSNSNSHAKDRDISH